MYISTESIKQAYQNLSISEISDASLLHISIILKGVGLNEIEYNPISDILSQSYDSAFSISSLFSPDEELPTKFQFANPFNMQGWKGQPPSEALKKWSTSRVKNNVIGGAVTWKKLINHDEQTDQLKFKSNYLEILKSLCDINKKIDFVSFSIWAHRFNKFETHASLSELINSTVDRFNIEPTCFNYLFTRSSNVHSVTYNNTIHSTSEIRKLVGIPPGLDESWLTGSKKDFTNEKTIDNLPKSLGSISIMNAAHNIDEIKSILIDYGQLILYGPPGTSKSYYANQLAKHFDTFKKIQFHPTYSYQEFIGGYSVNGTEVIFKKGVLTQLVQRIKEDKDSNKKHLLIIDEINRAHLNQVFGEIIQCLDRNYSVDLELDKETIEFSLPKNLFIIGTMNSSDRSVGGIDHAIRRRFMHIYCPPTPNMLKDNCTTEENFSLEDLLNKINGNLYKVLKNKELCIGHAVFLRSHIKDLNHWSFKEIETIFNHKILPTIEEFCNGDENKIVQIAGNQLSSRVTGDNFVKSLKGYTEQ